MADDAFDRRQFGQHVFQTVACRPGDARAVDPQVQPEWLMPKGVFSEGFPVGLTFQAPEPTAGLVPVVIDCVAQLGSVEFTQVMLVLVSGDNSPKLGARNDVPHEPLIVKPRSVIGVQLNATLGLLVPSKSLYWS